MTVVEISLWRKPELALSTEEEVTLTKHIGIVACSAEGASLCYRTVCSEGANLMGRYSHPEVTMHTYCLRDYMRCIEADDWLGVASLMVSSARKVAKAGADFIICPDNTIHQAFDLVVGQSPLPWLDIAGVVVAEAKRRSYEKVAVLGTQYLMEGPVYANRFAAENIRHLVPKSIDRGRINTIIFEELVQGLVSNKSLLYFKELIHQFKDNECDAVVLGCTELPILISDEDSPLPLLDSTRLLARAALKRAAKGS